MSVAHPISRRVTKACNTSSFGGNSLDTVLPYQDRTLNSIILDRIPKEVDVHSYTERETDVVNLKGWRICLGFENTTTDPLVIQLALVAVDTHDEGTSVTLTDEFFRNYITAQRTENFTSTATGIEYGCFKTNNDKYKTIHRWSKTLDANQAGVDERRRFWLFKRYLKFPRQLIYDSTEATEGTDSPHNVRIFLVHWAHKIIQNPGAAVPSYNLQGSMITFWKDVRSY